MRYFFGSLAHNLAAGVRLAALVPAVPRASFRFELAQLVTLVIASALIDIGSDWLGIGPGAKFDLDGLQGELYALGLLVFTTALLAALWRDAKLYIALPVMVFAGVLVIQLVHAIPLALPASLDDREQGYVDLAVVAWMALTCMRAVFVALEGSLRHRRLRAVAGGLLLIAPLWLSQLLGPQHSWWQDDETTEDNPIASPASEAVLATQDYLLDHMLDDLADEREDVTDLYFVAFAPDARHDGFRVDVEAAQQAMDDHWGTAGRSLVLVNNPRTVAEYPFASVTYLRKSLEEIGDIIDADQDIAMFYLAGSAGSDHALRAVHPPLDLVSLTPAALRKMLDDADIKYRVIVVSACYSGAWVDQLKDDYTAIVASSAAGTRDAACEGGDAATRFGAAFFAQGMARVSDLELAVAEARKALPATAAKPVVWVGPEVKARLQTLGHRNGAKTLASR